MSEIRRLQAFLRVTATHGRTVVSVAPFTVTIDPRDPLRFHNYAIPDDGAKPGAAAVAALRETFRSHDRLPRLEWIEEAAPLVAAVLATCGMTEELRTPLMACAPSELVDAPADAEDLSIEPVRESDLLDLERLQRAAFGDAPLLPDEEPRDPRSRGGGAVLARAGGVPVSAAAWTPVVDGLSEVAGVATAEAWRRRGLAGAVTAAAARAAFAAGASLCVLSPGDDLAQRVYARAGFRRVATMLHWSDPD